jgi:hypothetical protein
MALEIKYKKTIIFALFDAQIKTNISSSIIYEDVESDPVLDWLFAAALADQYDGGDASSDVSILRSSFSG